MSPVEHNGYWLVDGAVVNPVPVSLTGALGADIVIAVDLQHDAHLMQQDLLSVNVGNINEESDDALPRHKRLKERFSSLTSRRGVSSSGAMEIMTTSIRCWKIVLNVTVWLAIRLIFSFNHSVRKSLRWIFIAPMPLLRRVS